MQKVNILVFSLMCSAFCSCNQPKTKVDFQDGIDRANMDTTVSPGDDFDTYANGNWKKLNPLPDDKSRYGTFDKLGDEADQQLKDLFQSIAREKFPAGSDEKKIADFYSSGMDTVTIEKQGISSLKPMLAKVDQLKNKKELQQLIARWHSQGIDPLFSLYADADSKNSTMEVAHLQQGGLGLPNRDYYINKDAHSQEIQKKYRAYIAKIFRLIGVNAKQASQDAQIIYHLEDQLAQVSMSMLDERDPYKTYNKMDIKQLTANTSSYNWKAYFKNIGLDNPGEIIVGQPDFFKGMTELMNKQSLLNWKLYMKWNLINNFTGYLPKAYNKASFDFYGKELTGSLAQRPRWKRVQGATQSAMSMAVGKLYVKKYFPPEAKQRMVQLVENLRTSLGQRIQQLTWMSDTTKQKALEKLKAITVKVGYPDKWKNYSALTITPESYLQNALNAGAFNFNYMIQKINKPVDKTEWMMPPQMVNAYYNPSGNEIVFPAAILQPPFFYMHGDDAENYGAIGVVIGHEMSHGFDDEGRQYDKYGNLKDWWTAQDAKRFNAKTKALADEFSQFTVLDSVKANGKLTLGENIADLGGLNIAYHALHMQLKGTEKPIDGFTPDQRFFLSYAHLWAQNIRDAEKLRLTKVDVHSLGRYRILGPLSNMPEFYKTFGVKKGDKMYREPAGRVTIW